MTNPLAYQVSRVLNAPVSRVWSAWTDAQQIASWYGPVGFTTPRESVMVEPFVKGRWRATVIVPMDGSAHHFFGHFTEVVENSSLKYTMFYATDETLDRANGPHHEVELTFEDLGDKTRLTFTQFGELPEDQIPLAKAGMESYFDSLAAFVE